MLDFLQGHVPLVVGTLLAVLLIGLRAAVKDPILRVDLRGATLLLLAFLGVRTFGVIMGTHIPPVAQKAVQVIWRLAFAFGLIRAVVSVVLAFLRLRARPTPKILRDVIDFSLYFLAAVPILKSELEFDVTGLLATSAIVSVVIGLALQDTLGNLFAGLSIQLERPFQVGDIVAIEQHVGRVVQVAWRATRLETLRRELITLPNSTISKQPVTNYSRGPEPMGVDLPIGVAFSVPPNQVKDAVLDVLRGIPTILKDPPPSCRTQAFEESHVRYRVRFFLSDYLQKEPMVDEIHSRLWYRFNRDGIEIPFPTRTVHLHRARRAVEAPPDSGETRDELLKSVDLFAPLSDDARAELLRGLVPRRFGRGERIIQEGDDGRTFYLVVSGEVAVKAGKSEVEVAQLRRGQYFGEMSLLTGEPRAATVVAGSDSVLLELDRPVFARLFADNPGLAQRLSSLLAQRRSQLRAIRETTPAPDALPEERRIFGLLKQIFGLSPD